MIDHKIWIVDEVIVQPGQGAEFLEIYLSDYAPGARSRMTLEHQLVDPSMWLTDKSNRLVFMWSVPDAGAVWGTKHIARMSDDGTQFWKQTAPPFVVSRKRAIMADASQVKALADV